MLGLRLEGPDYVHGQTQLWVTESSVGGTFRAVGFGIGGWVQARWSGSCQRRLDLSWSLKLRRGSWRGKEAARTGVPESRMPPE